MDEGLIQKFNEVEHFHWWWEGRRELLRNLMTGLRSNPKILDIGCGTGETLSFLHKTFPKASLWGIDKSSMAVKLSKGKGHKNITQATALNLPFKNNTFDLVLFLDVLEHIKDHTKALREAKRVLRKGGKIIITAPAAQSIWSKHDSMQKHQRRYSKKIAEDLATNLDLKILRLGYFNFFLFLPISAIRLVSRLRPLAWLASYDNSLNYEVARVKIINRILRSLFVFEVRQINSVAYPFGVSLFTVLVKK